MTDTVASNPPPAPAWRRALPILISLAILALALRALSNEFSEHGYRQIHHAFQLISAGQVALALLLGLCSYACLIGFDAIGLRRSGKQVHPARVGITAFLAHAAGQTLGFAALTGGAVRLRGYGSAGLSLAEIGQVVLMSTLGFVFGAWVLLGLALVFEPDAAARVLPIGVDAVRAAGVAAIAGYALMLVLVGGKGRSVGIGRHALWLPDWRTVLGVTALSVVELGLASAAFYVLLPPLAGTGYVGFVGLWLVAVLAGLVSTVPAGLGVFEWSMLKLLPGIAPAALLAAALVYRVTYYLVPLLISTVLAAAGGLRRPVRAGAATLHATWSALRPWLPQIIALAVFAVGAALVIDGTLPTPRRRQTVAPLPLIETSHLLVSLGGVLLLLIGQGLQRRSSSAWVIAMVCCIALAPLSLLRGSHYSVALCTLLMAAALWLSRHEFYRESALLDEAWSWRWLGNLGLVLVATVWLLFFVYSHVEYSNELWWEFASSANAPRALRALLIVAVAVVVFGLARLLRSTRRPLPPASEAELDTLAPVLAAATDSQACLAFTGDKALLRDEANTGFVMMQRHGGSLIAMGDPVGPPDTARQLIWRFREEADRLGLRPVFYQVGEAYWQTYLDLGLSLVKLGEEAMVSLQDFSLEGSARADLRQAFNKGKRSGLEFRILEPAQVEAAMPALTQISRQWLDEKAGEEKGFSLGSFDPVYLRRFPIAVVEHEGRIVAFANLWTAPAGHELSVDLMRHADDAPKGTMDYLFVAMFLWGREQGYTRFSLGMAPLSGLAQHRLAGRWNRFANLVARHGERFYGFSGLRRFKAKFAPNWRARYLAAPGGMHLPAALLDVTRLISLEPRRREPG
ncbi:bifunctional lysylphosphatidylglycerol flippase/synthetase MprF [Stenotrophomonas sp. MMGLT7]|uniref:bifunctional lysylphosphatidylglycerol flippase/synthetase MprF n=1 Tax=Stenotrophomonas sp. MMGLT7 TaxID=2901227 RepID=UPI001E5CD51E|nr:bifunctional lysylphosphatidylglycerol flippase/synthetase MprF [Stenotrophomonas sp. MMGLT7]MCD7097366.1 bifunctional lysylphosphatidylglycerol flippase/synthetase MprF [Stenotrophomonas sp. MMGLT7]